MTAMPRQEKIIIRTPFPTDDEVAEFLGLTPKRRAELELLYKKIRHKMAEEDRRKRARRMRAKKK